MFIEPLERPHPLRRRRVAAGVALAIVIFLLIMYNETPISKGKSVFYIPSSSPESVAKSLQDNGYELNGMDLAVLHLVQLPEEGWYRIYKREAGRYFFFKNLHKKRVKTLTIRIFAGETKKEIFHRLSRELMLDEAKLDGNYTALARFEEGNILADRYRLPRSADEETVIRYLIDHSNTELDLFAREQLGEGFSMAQMREALIIASIIQKESNDIREMPLISSVIQNRLKIGMRLQMDGTLNYGEYSRTIVTPERIKSDSSRYNTYKYKGLIPAPLGSVSIEAFQAAISPKESDYLFFMLNEKGRHDFSESYKKHLLHVKAFKAYCRQKKEKENCTIKPLQTSGSNSKKTKNISSEMKKNREKSTRKPDSSKAIKKMPEKRPDTEKKVLPRPKKKQDIKALFKHIDINTTSDDPTHTR